MASSSTNKQPLLIDRPLHVVSDLTDALVSSIAFTGANTARMLVNGIGTDGCLIEDIYLLSTGTTALTVNLYLSSSQDYLRPTEGVYIGQFQSGSTAGERTEFTEMPRILAPVPVVGDEPQLRALYIPKGKVLWAGIQSATAPTDAPVIGVQGGWY